MIRTAKTENGYVRGIPAADPRITSFKGIPFAAPPVGELRWKAPRKAADWNGVRDCIEFAPISMQNIPGLHPDELYSKEWNVDPEIPMSEDCLYLNIWTPAAAPDEKLPVYIWFFGGALQFGNTAEMEFDGERIARRGIVVVTVNYRLNVFGFFAHPQLTAESSRTPTNFGNLDQQFGIQWTWRNIQAFGGNPENITIGGQSAGGGSVLTQLNYPENKKYIKKAVIESGMFLNPYSDSPYTTLEEAEKKGEYFLDYLGVSSIQEARELPAEYIRDKNEESGIFWWTSQDGCFQKEFYYKSLIEGRLPDIPLLLGYTGNEFWEKPQVSDSKELEQLAGVRFGAADCSYLNCIKKDSANFEEMLDKGRIHTIRLAILYGVKKMEENGKRQPVYCYEFAPDIPGADRPGTFHSSELWFFFETLAKCWRPFQGVHYDLARQMCNYLTNFIRTGDPNGTDADGTAMERWIPYTEEKRQFMFFGNNLQRKTDVRDGLTDFFLNLDILP